VEHFLNYQQNELQPDAPTWLVDLRERIRADNNFIKGMSCISELTDKSREHVARSMKKHYGVTVSEYINDLRLSYIANMLRYSNHDILDIVFESGFNNVSWCYKCFAKKYGVTPSAYRCGAEKTK
jgi:AraC family cel operon transcriptional repressor